MKAYCAEGTPNKGAIRLPKIMNMGFQKKPVFVFCFLPAPVSDVSLVHRYTRPFPRHTPYSPADPDWCGTFFASSAHGWLV